MSMYDSKAVRRIPFVETPKVFLTWDGIMFEELGIMEAVKDFTFTSTVARTSSSKTGKKFFHGGRPKVGNTTITFAVDDTTLGQRLNKLLIVRARPEIGIGVKLKNDAGKAGKGVWIGSFLVDKVNWEYGLSGTSLKLTGKKKKVLGLTTKTKPRVWFKKKASEIPVPIGFK